MLNNCYIGFLMLIFLYSLMEIVSIMIMLMLPVDD